MGSDASVRLRFDVRAGGISGNLSGSIGLRELVDIDCGISGIVSS